MAQLTFDIDIAAPAKKVWQVLWADATYRQWTTAFSEGSYAVSDWQQGSKIQFLNPDGSGMYGVIDEMVPDQKMVFRHVGEVKKFEEQPAADWGEGKEGYTLTEKDGTTTVHVTLDAPDNFLTYFQETFPKAMAKVKEIAENPIALTISTVVGVPVEKAWDYWTDPAHIVKWNNASPDWHSPRAENDVRPGGIFNIRMEAKDGSVGFDFGGTYDAVALHKQIAYTLGDGRKVAIQFSGEGDTCTIVETFEAEGMHPLDFQQAGWQAILNNYKQYTENN